MSTYTEILGASAAVIKDLEKLEPQFTRAAQLLVGCLLAGGKLLACGNGGSATDAAHLTGEFVGRFTRDRHPYPAIALTTDGGLLTALINDYPPEEVFARQVRAFARPGDLLVAFTTSGNSRNVLRAIETANECGIQSVAFLGRTGGFTKGIATVDLLVESGVTARIQEAHAVLFHALCEVVDQQL